MTVCVSWHDGFHARYGCPTEHRHKELIANTFLISYPLNSDAEAQARVLFTIGE